MTPEIDPHDPRWTPVPATLTITVPYPTDLEELGHRLVNAVCAASTTEDELGPARPLTLSLWQLELQPATVAHVMARAERARRLDVMDGRVALSMRSGFWHRSWGAIAERYLGVRLRGVWLMRDGVRLVA
ncbi:hypothetical protein [Streptomyces sannanensis]|uniref:hypothetical protein n=1 Tax=Streptomyces sannanensis TaxID=285536 RepID=UPI0031EDDD82